MVCLVHCVCNCLCVVVVLVGLFADLCTLLLCFWNCLIMLIVLLAWCFLCLCGCCLGLDFGVYLLL